MAAVTALVNERAHGIAGSSTPYNGADDRSLFECYGTGSDSTQRVMRYQDIVPIAGFESDARNIKYIAFRVIAVEELHLTVGGVTEILDQSKAFGSGAVADSGVTTRAVPGWDHTTTPAATVAATTASSPFFHAIEFLTGTLAGYAAGKVDHGVHQSQITTDAQAAVYVAANA